ncbi:MAG: aspartyl protease [Clostridiales bacterium]|nr:aspartyl protease [Clostridiales bacterium]
MQIEYRDGLLFTEIEVVYNGKRKSIANIVVDTGASKTLISQDSVDDIGIKVKREDEIVTSYGIGGKEHAFVKKIDKVLVGDYFAEEIALEFTVIQYEDINGLLGLDLLMDAGFNINLKDLKMDLHG